MSRQCEIVQDLLPLYVDEICSTASREMVAEHVSSCENCAAVLRRLKNNEIDQTLTTETEGVLQKQNRRFRRKTALWGMIIGAAMMIPVIICLIVTLAGGSSVGSLLVVLTALLLGASLVIVPLVFPKNKFLWTVGLGTVCLILLFAAAILPQAGGATFLVAVTSSLFGLHVVLAPIVVNQKALRTRLGKQKALIVMAADTLWFVLMMLSIGLLTSSQSFHAFGLPIAAIFVGFAWLIFVIIRYVRGHGLVRAGLCCIVTGGFIFVLNNLMGAIQGLHVDWPQFEPFLWNMYTIDGNIKWLCLIIGVIVGIVFIIIGLIKGGRK